MESRNTTYRIHQNSVGATPHPSGGKSARKIRGSSPRSGGRERCADCTEIGKSHSRLGYPLAASGQTFKSASPATRGGERIARVRSLSPPLWPSSFFTYAPRLVRERDKKERERKGGREGRYRGNNGTQWAGESGFFLAFAIALVKFCLFGSRTLAFSRHTQGMYRMIRRVRVKIIQNLHVETNRKYRFLLNYRCENLDRRSTRTLNFFFSFCNFTKTCCLAFNDTTRAWKEEKTSR